MNMRFAAAMGAALLVGCGGGGSNKSTQPPELSGVFKAGNVIGLHYRTPTRDGVTDAMGTFKYLAGESVTFSVGAIELGSAPGAATISPFTLAGLTPPTTETALRRELDRASRTTSPFVRAVNIDRFLLALDADHDPANGIDVRAKSVALANASLDFNLPIASFDSKLDRVAPNLTDNIPRWYPVVHLYRVLGIVVPAHVPVETSTELSSFPGWNTAITYFPDGSRESQESFDGFQGSLYSQSFTYDSLGRRTSSRFVSAPSLSGGFSEIQQSTYGERGTWLRHQWDRDDGSDGSIDFRTTVTFEIGDYNNVLRQQTRSDAGNDGTADSLSDFQITYNDRLNVVRSVSESDLDADGTVDSRATQTFEYDASHRVVSRLSEIDEPADGNADMREVSLFTYDSQGAGALEIYQRDEDVDGAIDYINTRQWNYDGNRLRTLESTETQISDVNGQPLLRLLQTQAYDDDGHVVREDQSQDLDGIAGFDVITRTTYTYTDFGSPLRQVSESDVNADGQVDTVFVTDYVYGAAGDLLSSSGAYTSGVVVLPPMTTSMRFTNTLLADGVLALAQQYFEFSFSAYVDVVTTF